MAEDQTESQQATDLRRDLAVLRGRVDDLQVQVWATALAATGVVLVLTLALPWLSKQSSAEPLEGFGRSDDLSGWGVLRAALAAIADPEAQSPGLLAFVVFLVMGATLVLAGAGFTIIRDRVATWLGSAVMILAMTYGFGMVMFGILLAGWQSEASIQVAAAPWIAAAAGFAHYWFAKQHRRALQARAAPQRARSRTYPAR